MNIQIKIAIIAIVIVIPIKLIAVYGTNSNQQFTNKLIVKTTSYSSFYTLHEFSQNVGTRKS